MNSLIAQRAHRAFSGMPRYVHLDTREATERWNGVLRPNEVALGLYQDESSSVRSCIVLTDRGLHLKSAETGRWNAIDYADIERVGPLLTTEDATNGTASIKREIDSVTVHLQNGRSVVIAVTGGGTRFRDAYQFYRFLRHAVVDARAGLGDT